MNNEVLVSIIKVIICFIVGFILGRIAGRIYINKVCKYDALKMTIKLIHDQCNNIKYISLKDYKKILYFDTWEDVLKYIAKHQKRCKGKVFSIDINTKLHYFMIIDKYNIEEVLI